MEDFYTLQGEGFHTGKAAYFLRIGGCDVGCYWCDAKETWNPDLRKPTDTMEIVNRVLQRKAQTVVITGGEPLMYNLDPLCAELKKKDIQIHLETSGSHPFSGIFDWITLSPKRKSPPLDAIYARANELKVIVFEDEDFLWAEENEKWVSGNCKLYLQPEWSRMPQMMQKIVDYILEKPHWNVSLQTHKFMHIP